MILIGAYLTVFYTIGVLPPNWFYMHM